VTPAASDQPTTQAISPPTAARSAIAWRLTTRSRMALTVALVGAPALLLYLRTLMPDVGFWDTAEFQAIGPVLGIAHPTGYPSYTLLAWLASVLLQPFGNEAYRADLLSALLVAGAAALLAIRATQATARWPLGVLAGMAFAVTPIAWRLSTRADAHALHTFLAALILVLLAAWARRARAGQPGPDEAHSPREVPARAGALAGEAQPALARSTLQSAVGGRGVRGAGRGG